MKGTFLSPVTDRVPTPILIGGLLGLVLLLGPIVAPFVFGAREMSILIRVYILALWAISFNILFGYTGLLSFGPAAYYGAAAYMIPIIVTGAIWFVPGFMQSFFVAMLIGIVVATLLAMVIGALCVQRGGIYFAMLTFAFSMMVYHLARRGFQDITGGDDGIILPAATTIDLGVISFFTADTMEYYYITIVFVAIAIYLAYRILQSPYGELLISIRENQERASFVGINVKFYQWTAFVLSGLFSGIAGTLVAARNFVITPDILHWSVGVDPILATLIGGPGLFLGPAVGALIYVLLEEVISTVTAHWHFFVGLILIPLVLFLPGGVYGYFREERENTPLEDVIAAVKTRRQSRGGEEEE